MWLLQPEASSATAAADADSVNVQPAENAASMLDSFSADSTEQRSSPFAGGSQASAFDDLGGSATGSPSKLLSSGAGMAVIGGTDCG